MVEFVLIEHFRLAVHAAALFGIGLLLSWPVVHYRMMRVAWLPLRVFRIVVALMGPRPPFARMTAVIFGFNALTIFLYLAGGWHPVFPKLCGLWIGMNVAIVAVMGREDERIMEMGRPGEEAWVPGRPLSMLCGLAVMLLELPCFWYALAMGMSLGDAVQDGRAPYLEALGVRALAYVTLVAPALLVSAAAESAAIRGMAARKLDAPDQNRQD